MSAVTPPEHGRLADVGKFHHRESRQRSQDWAHAMQELEPRILLSATQMQPALAVGGPVATVLDLKEVSGRKLEPARSEAVSPMFPHRARTLGINFTIDSNEATPGTDVAFDIWDYSWAGLYFQYDAGYIYFTLSGTATYGDDMVISAGNMDDSTHGGPWAFQ